MPGRPCHRPGRRPSPLHFDVHEKGRDPRLDRLDRRAGARRGRPQRRPPGRRPGGRRPLGAPARPGGGVRRASGSASPTRRRRPRPPRRGAVERSWPAPRAWCGWWPSPGADLVLNGLVGSAGLGPTVAALGEGIDVALANKESLVVGGELVMQLAEATGARVIPVDSEHSALFQLLRKEPPGTVERLVLTASGGPFRGLTPGRAGRRRRAARRWRTRPGTWAARSRSTPPR